MKTCIATGLKADGTHVVLYVGPDAAKALGQYINPNPTLGLVAAACFIRPIPSKARKFDQVATAQASQSQSGAAAKPGNATAVKTGKAAAVKPGKAGPAPEISKP